MDSNQIAVSTNSPEAVNYYPPCSSNETSLVDGLNKVGETDTSFNNRCKIAKANGIDSYAGESEENIFLLSLLKAGLLVVPNSSNDQQMGSSQLAVSTDSSETIPEIVNGIDNGITITKDNAPVRTSAGETSDIAFRAKKGSVLEVVGTEYTHIINKWYKVSYNGKIFYIYSKNAKPHNHSYEKYSVSDFEFKVCSCGKVAIEEISHEKVSLVKSGAIIGASALPLAAADGPFPVGDIIAASIVIAGVYAAYDASTPTTSEVVDIVTDVDFLDYLKGKGRQCTPYTFRSVIRQNKTLVYTSPVCMNATEAYVYVLCLKGDVYTPSEDAALMLAAMHGSAIMERDKDKQSYFYHYHLGLDRSSSGHIFFDTNDFGETPLDPFAS